MKFPADATVKSLFQEAALQHEKKVAVVHGDQKITYGELMDKARKISASLAGMGVQKGDRVALLLRNCPEYIAAFYAVLMRGAAVVPVNTMLKAEEVQHILNDSAARVLVSSHDFSDIHQSLRSKLPKLGGIYFVEHEFSEVGGNLKIAAEVVTPADLAVVIYTSGTTGRPKGAMLTHGNLVANIHSCREVLGGRSNDRFILLLPMFHSFMMTVCILLPLSLGASILLIKSLSPAKNIFREIIRSRGTILPAIPQLFQAMSQAATPFWFNWIFPVRVAISGAAPLPEETLKAFSKKYRFPLLEGYGLSEAGPVVSFNPLLGRRKPNTVGLPVPGVEVSIRGEDGRVLPVGETGEVCVRGANVMKGYWNQPEETAAALRNGWLHTGDLGRLDQDGYLAIVDRKKDMLLVRGMNVYPREIEEVLLQFPGVKEAAVVGRPDEKKGEVPLAFVTPLEGVSLDTQAVARFLKEKLADYKQPREIRVLGALPRNATGKVLKTELRKLA